MLGLAAPRVSTGFFGYQQVFLSSSSLPEFSMVFQSVEVVLLYAPLVSGICGKTPFPKSSHMSRAKSIAMMLSSLCDRETFCLLAFGSLDVCSRSNTILASIFNIEDRHFTKCKTTIFGAFLLEVDSDASSSVQHRSSSRRSLFYL